MHEIVETFAETERTTYPPRRNVMAHPIGQTYGDTTPALILKAERKIRLRGGIPARYRLTDRKQKTGNVTSHHFPGAPTAVATLNGTLPKRDPRATYESFR